MIDVVLDGQQMLTAAMVGVRRTIYAISNGLNATYGGLRPGDPGAFDNHILACMCEYSVAKHFNLFWDEQIGRVDGVDVGGFIEVRTIREQHLRLILHRDDYDLPFVLVWARPPRFSLVGWLPASDGKREEFWEDPVGNRPAFFVPRSFPPMRPIETLIPTLRAMRQHALQPQQVAQ